MYDLGIKVIEHLTFLIRLLLNIQMIHLDGWNMLELFIICTIDHSHWRESQ